MSIVESARQESRRRHRRGRWTPDAAADLSLATSHRSARSGEILQEMEPEEREGSHAAAFRFGEHTAAGRMTTESSSPCPRAGRLPPWCYRVSFEGSGEAVATIYLITVPAIWLAVRSISSASRSSPPDMRLAALRPAILPATRHQTRPEPPGAGPPELATTSITTSRGCR